MEEVPPDILQFVQAYLTALVIWNKCLVSQQQQKKNWPLLFLTYNQFSFYRKLTNKNWLQIKNNNGQINCYQNVGTKLTMTPKYKNQNDIFALKNTMFQLL